IIILAGAGPMPGLQEQWLDATTRRIESVPASSGLLFSPYLRVFLRDEPPENPGIQTGPEPIKFRLWDLGSGKARGPVMKRSPLGMAMPQRFEGSLATVVFSPDRKLFIVQPQPDPWGQPDPWASRGATLWNTITRMPVGRHISGGA